MREDGKLESGDYILKESAKSKFGKLMKKYAPHVGERKGPRFRLWRFTGDNGPAADSDELPGTR
jgi:hypothetical protein